MTNEKIYEVLSQLLSEEVERLNEILEVVVVRLDEMEEELKEKNYEINELYKAVAELN